VRAINHAMTGALIGLTIGNPVVAVPLAIASHFVLDAIPHYADDKRVPINSKIFAIELVVDAVLCGLLVLALFLRTPDDWLVPSISALAAASPDFMSVARYLRGVRFGNISKDSKFAIRRFHTRIQNESPKAWPVEIIWAIGCMALIARLT
jgi:hypothetical protein